MATYTVSLTPALRNFTTEGGLDTAVVNDLSIQRTMNALLIKNGTEYKMVGKLEDGDTFTDVVDGLGDYPNIIG